MRGKFFKKCSCCDSLVKCDPEEAQHVKVYDGDDNLILIVNTGDVTIDGGDMTVTIKIGKDDD
jgi:hypothetical protein